MGRVVVSSKRQLNSSLNHGALQLKHETEANRTQETTVRRGLQHVLRMEQKMAPGNFSQIFSCNK